MKYREKVYVGALQALAALRKDVPEKERATIDFIAEAIAEKETETGATGRNLQRR